MLFFFAMWLMAFFQQFILPNDRTTKVVFRKLFIYIWRLLFKENTEELFK